MDSIPLEIDSQKIFFKSSESMDEMESNTIQLVVTSPPYWNVRDYDKETQIGFNQTYDEYVNSLNKVWTECLRVLAPNGKIAINIQPLPIPADQSQYERRSIFNIMWDIEHFMRKNGLYLSGMHYWDKSQYVSNVSWGSYPKPTNINSNTGFEQIFVWVKKGKTRIVNSEIMDKSILLKEEWRHWAVRCFWDDISPVIKINSKGENLFGHSAPYPEDIPYRLIRMHTVLGEKVLDPFLGSGTTLKVCKLLKRKGIGYETNKEYKKLIIDRINQHWLPPSIEHQYKVFGDQTIYEIIDTIVNKIPLNEDKEKIMKNLLRELGKKFPNKFTTSYKKHILSNYLHNT